MTALPAPFGATVVQTMTARPGYAWYRCERCGEHQYKRQCRAAGTCVLTPYCRGVLVLALACRCEGCGAPLTGRSKDGRYCRAACRALTPREKS